MSLSNKEMFIQICMESFAQLKSKYRTFSAEILMNEIISRLEYFDSLPESENEKCPACLGTGEDPEETLCIYCYGTGKLPKTWEESKGR